MAVFDTDARIYRARVLSLHKDVRQVVLRDLGAPDADGVAGGLDLLTALLQGPELLAEVTGSVL